MRLRGIFPAVLVAGLAFSAANLDAQSGPTKGDPNKKQPSKELQGIAGADRIISSASNSGKKLTKAELVEFVSKQLQVADPAVQRAILTEFLQKLNMEDIGKISQQLNVAQYPAWTPTPQK